jgi:hypothetical protein
MPGEYTAKMKSGFVPLTGPNAASIWLVKRIISARRPQARPKAIAKNGPSDRMDISPCRVMSSAECRGVAVILPPKEGLHLDAIRSWNGQSETLVLAGRA